jgi:hypothetical protein
MPQLREMTKEEKRQLIGLVLGREWVLLAIGVLVMGISLSYLLSSRPYEQIMGLALAILLLVAMGLFVWSKLQRDLKDPMLGERDVTIVEKHQTKGETTYSYWLVDEHGVEYDAPHRVFTRVEPGQMYHLVFTQHLHIVLSVERIV